MLGPDWVKHSVGYYLQPYIEQLNKSEHILYRWVVTHIVLACSTGASEDPAESGAH